MTTQWFSTPASHAARTDVGTARDHNEDRYLTHPPLFVVADGLGGQAAGEVAAQLLIDRLAEVGEVDGPGLIRAIEVADRAIYEASTKDTARRGMSTTCVALLINDGSGQVSHVGDSRAYRLRAGVLARLTADDSVVEELVRSGIIDEAQAEVDDRRHMLTQALGSNRRATVNSTPLVVERGDRYLLCSDGLSGQVPDREIEAVLVEHGDPGLAADELVRRSNAAGGIDNVTVIVIDAQVSEHAVPTSPDPAPAALVAASPSAPPTSRSRIALWILVLVALVLVGGALGYGLAGAALRPSSTPLPLATPLASGPDASFPGLSEGPPRTAEPVPTEKPSDVPGANGGSPSPSGSGDVGGAPASAQP